LDKIRKIQERTYCEVNLVENFCPELQYRTSIKIDIELQKKEQIKLMDLFNEIDVENLERSDNNKYLTKFLRNCTTSRKTEKVFKFKNIRHFVALSVSFYLRLVCLKLFLNNENTVSYFSLNICEFFPARFDNVKSLVFS